MPQYGVLVYLPAPADPSTLTEDYRASIERYPDRAKQVKAKVLGSTYFAAQLGFAFESSDTGQTISSDKRRIDSIKERELTPAAFFVLSAPDVHVAADAAALHPAADLGIVEVRPLVPAPSK